MKTSNIANGIANALNLSPKSLEIIADYVDINNKIYHNFNVVLEVVKTMAKLDVTPNSNNDFNSDNISVRGYNLSIPYETLPMITGQTFLSFSILDDSEKDNKTRAIDRTKQSLIIEQSKSLFLNRLNALNRFIKENILEFPIRFNSHYDLNLFHYPERLLMTFILDHFKFIDGSTYSLDDKDIISANLGGLKFVFNKEQFLKEFNEFTNMPDVEKAYKFLIYKYLGDFLSLLPDLEETKDIEKLLNLKNKDGIENTIRGMQARLVELGVTDMYGEFEIARYTSNEIIELISNIHFLQNPTSKPLDKVAVSHLTSNNKRGTFITGNGFDFSLSKEYEANTPSYRFAEKLIIRKHD